MTRELALKELKEAARDGDVQAAHVRADAVLCELLNELGYQDVVEAFDRVEKWYA